MWGVGIRSGHFFEFWGRFLAFWVLTILGVFGPQAVLGVFEVFACFWGFGVLGVFWCFVSL